MAGKPLHGGTTISGTMVLAHLAGIKVFGTGGLGMCAFGYDNSILTSQVVCTAVGSYQWTYLVFTLT
jgi:pseudouridine-5'-phosphate glycosidase